MLKYLHTAITFREVPNEISLCISISGCIQHCLGCHSPELWEDIGTPLTIENIIKLIEKNEGITCLCLLGGERDIDTIINIFKNIKKKYSQLKTAWYCGLDDIPSDKETIITVLDYYKVGHFELRLGGLDSPKTNQKFYKKVLLRSPNFDEPLILFKECTSEFQKMGYNQENN